jgi:hypothetical protein
MGADHRAAIERAGLGSVIRVNPVIPYLRSLALMGEADCTILVDAAVASGAESVFLPSKLVDYLGAEKPVIAITPPAGASARVTGEAGGMVCDVDDIDAIEALLADLAAGKRPAPLKRDAVQRYHYETVADRLVEAVRETANGVRGLAAQSE